MATRLTPHLYGRVMSLPLADRVALYEVLRTSFRTGRKDPKDRLQYLTDRMKDCAGVDVKDASREVKYTWPRVVFVFVARREGFTESEIGRHIGRDHSTVHHLSDRMNAAFSLPSAFADVIELYNKYIDTLTNEERKTDTRPAGRTAPPGA